MPGLLMAKLSSMPTMSRVCVMPSLCFSAIWLIRPKTLDSMNSISPSNICALLAKWRYRAASDTASLAASAAVVIFSPFGCSSIAARA